MRNNAVTSVKSLSALVPNLFIPDYGSKLTTSVYIRGIGSRINTPAIGLYVDNIPFIDKSAFDFNYADVERIDVMRGPQGTLYGRNTMGGLIRVFTKSPFTYQGTDLRLSAATYNNYQASLTHYHRISTQFAFSAGAFYSHKGGFFKNDFNGKRIDTDNEFGGRIRAIWLPTENLKLDFTVNYEYTNQGGYPYEYTGRTDGETEDRAGYIGRISYNNDCGYRRNLVNSGVNLEYQGRNFTLSSATGFQYLYDRMDLDQDFTEQDIYTIMQKQNSKTLSEEIVMKSKPGSRWQWTTGVSGFYQWLDTDAPVTFRPDGVKTMIEDNANSMFPSGNPAAPTMHLTVNNSTLPVLGRFETPVLNGVVYHQSTLNDLFVDGLSLTVGLRLDYEKIKMHYDSGTEHGLRLPLRHGSDAHHQREPARHQLLHRRGIGRLHAAPAEIRPRICMESAEQCLCKRNQRIPLGRLQHPDVFRPDPGIAAERDDRRARRRPELQTLRLDAGEFQDRLRFHPRSYALQAGIFVEL